MIIETHPRTRWSEIAQYLRSKFHIYASVATSSERKSYWNAFAYLYAPNGKKSKEDIDSEPLLSPGHEPPPMQLENRRQGSRGAPV